MKRTAKDCHPAVARVTARGLAALAGLLILWGAPQGYAASVRLAWDAPTSNTDGTALTDLAGYKLYHGVSSGNYSVVTNVGNVTTILVSNLAEGQTYYFSAKCYNTANYESDFAAEFVHVVPDVTKPVITPPAAQSVTVGSTTNRAALPNVVSTTVVTDNVSSVANILITQNPTAGTLVGLGATSVTITARDQAGNSAQATVQVTVVDRTAPVITPPAPLTVTAGLNDLAAVPNVLTSLVVTDNCTASGSIVKTQTPAAGAQVPVGTSAITIKATDASGNQATSTVSLAVLRANRAPVVNAGADLTVSLTQPISLTGVVTDDGLPTGATVTKTWTKVSGPGTVTFGSASSAATTANVSVVGTYTLRLTANDTKLSASDDVILTVLSAGVPESPTNVRVTMPQ